MKKTCYTEAAYLLGIIILAIGTAFMEKADFGMSMIVAPAYLLHLKASEYLPFFSFGMAEYVLQAMILVLLCLVMRRVKRFYFFSFITAVFYGIVLDGSIGLIAGIPNHTVSLRVLYYVVGMILCTGAVSLLFHTYIAPEAYELFVKELSAQYRLPINRVKTIYDCASCVLSILLSFLFYGWWQFEGIKWGTVLCALVNGWMIGRASVLFEQVFTFRDGLPFRKYFE